MWYIVSQELSDKELLYLQRIRFKFIASKILLLKVWNLVLIVPWKNYSNLYMFMYNFV
ncbi:hypothetical protein LguiA_027375 [Lonicera macranthoides]